MLLLQVRQRGVRVFKRIDPAPDHFNFSFWIDQKSIAAVKAKDAARLEGFGDRALGVREHSALKRWLLNEITLRTRWVA
ncbi:MAG: hypothetical protein M1369_02220, partial [Deinococcus sp.]|nr:hypothetical protein [Deinococcus sp.]